MPDLVLRGRKIATVFDLIGDKENDITYSVGWALANCPQFLNRFLGHVLANRDTGECRVIRLQESGKELGGFTDIEIETSRAHVIVEAKRGWSLPDVSQLERYAPRLQGSKNRNVIVVLSDCSPAYALKKLPSMVGEAAVRYASWEQVAGLAGESRRSGSHNEKRLLGDLRSYLEGLITMQNQESNRVYVVSLGADTPSWSKVSWREIVNTQKQYFHAFGISGWPKVPPNYMGFRYDGKLQSIHHVENYEIATDARSFARLVPGVNAARWRESEDYYDGAIVVYQLGPAIIPARDVVTGASWRASRVWVALDLLLTCDSIAQARDLTEKRTMT